MIKSIFESITNSRENLISLAESFIKLNDKKIICSVCNNEIVISYDENATTTGIYYTTKMFSPAFVRFNVHSQCEKIVERNNLKQHEQEQREFLKNGKEITYLNFVKSIDFPDAASVNIDELNNHDLLSGWSTEDDFGFIIRGQAGTGKSYIAVALAKKIAKLIIDLKKVEDLEKDPIGMPTLEVRGLPVFIKANKFFESTIENEYKIKTNIKNARYLFLDDVGTENITDFKREMFYNLIDHRSSARLPTFITTNLSLDQIKERFYERVSSRILGMCVPIEMKGADKRLGAVKDRVAMLRGRLGIK